MESSDLTLLTALLIDMKKDVSQIQQDLAVARAIAAENTDVLIDHTRRSLASEQRLNVQEQKLEEMALTLEPMKTHLASVAYLTKVAATILKVVGYVAAIASAAKAILSLR